MAHFERLDKVISLLANHILKPSKIKPLQVGRIGVSQRSDLKRFGALRGTQIRAAGLGRDAPDFIRRQFSVGAQGGCEPPRESTRRMYPVPDSEPEE